MTRVLLPLDVLSAPPAFMSQLDQIFGDFEELVHLLMASPSYTEFLQYCDASAWSMVETASDEGWVKEAEMINSFWKSPATNLWLMDFYEHNRQRAEYLVGSRLNRFDRVDAATKHHTLVTIR